MGNNVFPSLVGQKFPGHSISYKSLSDEAMSKRLATLALQRYPIHTWTYDYEVLRDDINPSDIRAIVGLFTSCRGRFDTFLYTDPIFNSVTDQIFGTGDATTIAFQLVATFGNTGGAGASDIVQNVSSVPTIKVNGSTSGFSYTLGPTGIVTFTTPPAASAVLTWTGSFYYRCHFLNDNLLVQQFVSNFWSTQQLQFRSVLL